MTAPPTYFMLYDPETGRRGGMASYPSAESAEAMREAWLIRCDRGGRPDVSRDFLERLVVLPSRHDVTHA